MDTVTDTASRLWDAICEMQATHGAMTKAMFVQRYEEIVAAGNPLTGQAVLADYRAAVDMIPKLIDWAKGSEQLEARKPIDWSKTIMASKPKRTRKAKTDKHPSLHELAVHQRKRVEAWQHPTLEDLIHMGALDCGTQFYHSGEVHAVKLVRMEPSGQSFVDTTAGRFALN